MKQLASVFLLLCTFNCAYAQQYELKYVPTDGRAKIYIEYENVPTIKNGKMYVMLEKNDNGLSDLHYLQKLGLKEYISVSGESTDIAALLNKYEKALLRMNTDQAFSAVGQDGLDIIYSLKKEGASYEIILYVGEDASANEFLLKKSKK